MKVVPNFDVRLVVCGAADVVDREDDREFFASAEGCSERRRQLRAPPEVRLVQLFLEAEPSVARIDVDLVDDENAADGETSLEVRYGDRLFEDDGLGLRVLERRSFGQRDVHVVFAWRSRETAADAAA